METNFDFKSQICTSKSQSETLLKLGLKKETADMYITNMSRKGLNYTDDWQIGSISYCDVMSFWDSKGLQLEKTAWSIIPAWSLHRLWELLPKSIWHDNGLEKKYHPIIEYGFVNYVAECGMELFDFDCGYEVWGSMIVVIEWLIKEGYFNKEYLI